MGESVIGCDDADYRYYHIQRLRTDSLLVYFRLDSGKETPSVKPFKLCFIAEKIHARIKRAGKPFIAVDCGLLSKELAASDLFGHEKGAFTGAERKRPGVWEEATRGTLFLDEIGNLPLEVQQMLLRALETKRYRPTGGSKDKKADVRIIAEKRFRADLYQRLKEYTLHIPLLRECKEDDITLSSKIDFKSLLPLFLSLIRESGFAINHKKTHYKTKNPIVTGVICQNNRLLPPLGYKKKKARLRQELQTGKKSVEPQLRGLSTYLERISKT